MTAASPRPEEAKAGYAALFDSLPDAVLVVGSDGVITQVNAAAERLFGYSRLQLVGQDHRMLLAEGYRSGFDRLFASLRSESGGIAAAKTPFESYGLRSDGTEFHGEVACSLLDSDGGPSLVASVRATFHRQEADAELREAMSLLSATLESTADGILVVGVDGKIAGINEQFTKMWGIPRELLAAGDDAAVMDFVLGLLSHPESFLDKVNELYAHPTAESHDTSWSSSTAARSNATHGRSGWATWWWAGSGASGMSRRGAGPRNRPGRRWRISPNRQNS